MEVRQEGGVRIGLGLLVVGRERWVHVVLGTDLLALALLVLV